MKAQFIKSPLAAVKNAIKPIILVTAFVATGLAQAQQDSYLDIVDEFLNESGAELQVNMLPETLIGRIEQQIINSNAFDMNDPDQAKFANKIIQEFSEMITAHNIKRNLVNSLEDSVLIEELISSIAFYKTPAGQEVVKYETESVDILEDPEFISFMQQFENMPKDPVRLDQAKKIVELYKINEFAVDANVDSEIAAAMGMIDNMSEELLAEDNFGQSMQMYIDHMENQRESLYPQVVTLFIAEQYYTFREMDIEDVVEYSKYLESPDAFSVNTALLTGINNFSNYVSYTVGSVIAAEMSRFEVSSNDL